eukprot:jgi/Chlat1/8647/Chrsp87S08035
MTPAMWSQGHDSWAGFRQQQVAQTRFLADFITEDGELIHRPFDRADSVGSASSSSRSNSEDDTEAELWLGIRAEEPSKTEVEEDVEDICWIDDFQKDIKPAVNVKYALAADMAAFLLADPAVAARTAGNCSTIAIHDPGLKPGACRKYSASFTVDKSRDVTGVMWSPTALALLQYDDTYTIFSGADDGSIWCWKETDVEWTRLVPAQDSAVLALHIEGGGLFCALANQVTQIYKVKGGRLVLSASNAKRTAKGAEFTRMLARCVSVNHWVTFDCDGTGNIHVRDLLEARLCAIIRNQEKVVSLACDRDRLYCGTSDGAIKVRAMTSTLTSSYRHLYTLRGHTGAVRALAAKNNRLYSSSSDGTLRMWNRKSHVCENVFLDPAFANAQSLAVSVNRIVCGSQSHALQCWHLHETPANSSATMPVATVTSMLPECDEVVLEVERAVAVAAAKIRALRDLEPDAITVPADELDDASDTKGEVEKLPQGRWLRFSPAKPEAPVGQLDS